LSKRELPLLAMWGFQLRQHRGCRLAAGQSPASGSSETDRFTPDSGYRLPVQIQPYHRLRSEADDTEA